MKNKKKWCSPGPPVSSTNKTDHHDIHVAEILLKVALNTIKQTTSNLYLEIFSDIDFAFFYDFDILIWNCSDSVVFFCFSFYSYHFCWYTQIVLVSFIGGRNRRTR
jgi:hypothetical protein